MAEEIPLKKICFEPIGFVHTEAKEVPRFYTISQVKGRLEIFPEYKLGLKDIKPGDRIWVLFHFHKSPPFEERYLIQEPPHRPGEKRGVFSTCSPVRPNPIGLSALKVLSVKENIIEVEGLDIFDGTPILDIKPYKTAEEEK
ncbi:tRNA (N6-threonylcarbamoyladenosine(37)-N6)-methyltransferase TrmO [Thermodesulfatator atlanticus]